MSIDYTKLAEDNKVVEVKLSKTQTVHVGELPVYTLLKFKGLKTVLSGAVAKFMQPVPLSESKFTTDKVPLLKDDGTNSKEIVTTEISETAAPTVSLIDKAISVKADAIANAADLLLHDEFFFDLLVVSVTEFKDEKREELLGPDGLRIKQMLNLALAIVEVNSENTDKLGNFWSLLKGLMK